MKNFKKLDLPVYDNLLEELEIIINWKDYQQICVNTLPGYENDHQIGTGSLYYDWSKSYKQDGKLIVPERDIPLNESDFTKVADIFKGTTFEEIINMLKNNGYNLGRVRLMCMKPKTCLTWHTDTSIRLHYPLKTQKGCKMIIEDEVYDLETDTWFWTDTLKEHTAINASNDLRLHLVVAVV